MSKSTKIIAALGVAAGLGVAALPAASFAETYSGSINGAAITANDTGFVQPLAVNIANTLSLSGTTTGSFASADGVTLTAGQQDSNSQTVWTAICNDSDGWTVTVAPSSATKQQSATLYNGTGDDADSIAPFASEVTIANFATTTTSGWGILLANLATGVSAGSDFTTTGYNGVSGSNQVVTSAATSGTAGKNFTTKYGVTTADTQAGGEYKGSITFTIAAN